MISFSEKIYATSPKWLQNVFVSLYGIKQWEKRYLGDFMAILEQLRVLRYEEIKTIDEIRWEKLKQILIYCQQNIPFYHHLFKKNKIDIYNFKELNDLQAIPVLKKETFRKNYSAFFPKDYKRKKFIVQNTSGTTGTPLSVIVDKYTYRLAMALLVEHEELHGIKIGDRRATFAGRMIQGVDDNNPPFWRYNIAENQMLFSAYHLSEKNLSFYISKLNSFKPREIIGYPSAIYTVAAFCEQKGIRLDFIPNVVITNSETLLEWQRKVIENAFRCKIYDYYGSAEYIVFASQCNQLMYHINPLLGIIEVVNEDKISVRDESGKLVCTTLSNYAMPLIRYEIGDIGVLSNEHCKCGCNYQILKTVVGRIDDVVVTADGRKIGRLDHIFKGLKSIKEGQIIQVSFDKFKLRLVTNSELSNSEKETLISNLKKRVGWDIDVYIEFVANIERTSHGKFRGVVNECNKYIQ